MLEKAYSVVGNTLVWTHTKSKILIIRRPGDVTIQEFVSLLRLLQISDEYLSLEIFLESKEETRVEKLNLPKNHPINYIDTDRLAASCTWECLCQVNLVITLGGDGTLLYAASLFQSRNHHVPPILPFALGSLGFLTPIDFKHHEKALKRLLLTKFQHSESRLRVCRADSTSDLFLPRMRSKSIGDEALFEADEPVFILKRTRLFVLINKPLLRKATPPETRLIEGLSLRSNSMLSLNSQISENNSESPTRLSFNKRFVLNEVVIDRGPSHGSIHLELYINDKQICDIRGDGVLLSTPTGSTAYALSCGGSMIHPSTAGMLVTPICPHSLSARPFVIPPGVKLTVKVAEDCRNLPWVSFDGRDAHSLDADQSLSVILPERVEDECGFIIPCICLRDPVDDWFTSLSVNLQWNSTKLNQKPL